MSGMSAESEGQVVGKSPEWRSLVGLALGGGGARGLAHIGVLKVLEREGVAVDCVAGTSIGGVIAAAYASGMNADELEKEARASSKLVRLLQLTDPGFPNDGVLRAQRLQTYLQSRLGCQTFDQLVRPLAVVAVDLNGRQEVILRHGSVALAVRATIAVPGLFTPVEIGEQRLVDGGLINNLPVNAARALGADVVIAVDIQPRSGGPHGAGYYGEVDRTRWLPSGVTRTLATLDEAVGVMIAYVQALNQERYPPDVLIQPVPQRYASGLAFGRVDELVGAGMIAAEAALPKIRQVLAAR